MSAAVIVPGCVLGSYLLGAVPVGLLVAAARGVDIRRVGSGNIGATNVFRSVGRGWGLLTFALDVLKGWVPAAALGAWAGQAAGWPPAELGLLFGAAAIAGHNWPVYLQFKGGKGVATSGGVLLGVAPLAALAGFAVWAVVFAATRYVSVGSIAAAAAVPVFAWIHYGIRGGQRGAAVPAALTVLGALAIWRHRANIRRLLDGTEGRFRRTRRSGEAT